MKKKTTFQQLNDYLIAIQAMEVQGKKKIPGTALKEIEKPTLQSNEKKNNNELNYTTQSKENPNFYINPAEIVLSIKRPVYHLKIYSDTLTTMIVEGTFNDWGKKDFLNWRMKLSNDGQYFEGFIDPLSLNEMPFHAYRFRDLNKLYIDPESESVSFLPQTGPCCMLKKIMNPIITIPFQFQDEKVQHPGQALRLEIQSFPAWLKPQQKVFLIKNKAITHCMFLLDITKLNNSYTAGKICFLYNDTRNEISITAANNPEHIWAEPKKESISLDHKDVPWGKKVRFSVPVLTFGKGTIHLNFIGNGLDKKETITSNDFFSTHNIQFTLDTLKILPSELKKLILVMNTDSELMNKRHYKMILNFNIVKLIAISKKDSLNWKQLEWGIRKIETFEFVRSDTLEPSESITIENMSEELSDIIGYKIEGKNILTFSIDSRKLEYDTIVEDHIFICAQFSDNLMIRHKIPVHISFITTFCQININTKKWKKQIRRDHIHVTIKNTGQESLKIFHMYWKNDRFISDKSIWEKHNCVLPGQSLNIEYFAKKRERVLFHRKIVDKLIISCNDQNTPEFQHKIQLRLQSKILCSLITVIKRFLPTPKHRIS